MKYLTEFSGGSVVKNMPASAGDVRDSGSVSGSGRSSEGMAIHSRQEYWVGPSGLLFPSPGDVPIPGIKSVSPASPAIF